MSFFAHGIGTHLNTYHRTYKARKYNVSISHTMEVLLENI